MFHLAADFTRIRLHKKVVLENVLNKILLRWLSFTKEQTDELRAFVSPVDRVGLALPLNPS